MLLSLTDSISDSLKAYSITISTYAHSYMDGVSLPLYEMKHLPPPPPQDVREGAVVGGVAEECVGPRSCPEMRSVVLSLIDELGRMR